MGVPGTLFLVATPIGNLEDISLRALRILKEADLIACEDTRQTAKLLSHYGITTVRESYHEHNETAKTPRFISLLKEGKSIALVTDAGTPAISDPGYILIAACSREGIAVIPIPGPSAAIAALTASGLGTENFFFAGFLPPRQSQRRKQLQELASLRTTLIFYESPHRVVAALEDMVDILGPRQACLARELTKIHEEWIRGSPAEIMDSLKSRQRIRGEITIVIDGVGESPQPAVPYQSIKEHIEAEIQSSGASPKDALKAVAKQRGLSKSEAYRLLLEEKNRA